MYRLRLLLLLPLAAAAGCALLPARTPDTERLAAGVTIARDEYGIPHITAQTDAGVAFGIAWAQAEDAYALIEESYIHALGRAAHWYGESHLGADVLRAALEVERHAREEYTRQDAGMRALLDAYAAGLNHWMRTSGAAARLIARYEPWMPLALIRSIALDDVVAGIRLGVAGEADGYTLAGVRDTAAAAVPRAEPRVWAVPAQGNGAPAVLVQSQPAPLFGPGRLHELQVHSGEGWHARGVAVLGTPVIRAGHGARIAWAPLTRAGGQADAGETAFAHDTDPLMYHDGSAWQRAVEWTDTIMVNGPDGVAAHVLRFRRTQHGPVVAQEGTRAVTLRLAGYAEGGVLAAWHRAGRAQDVEGFVRAFTNAPAAGRVLVVDGRSMAVADADPATAPAAIPQAEPFTSSGATAAEREADALLRAAFSARVGAFDEDLAALSHEWEVVGGRSPARARRVDEALDELRAWDGVADTTSAATTLFVLWQERLRTGGVTGELARFRALELVVEQLETARETVLVPWGSFNRLQPPSAVAPLAFDDARPASAATGLPAWTGAALVLDGVMVGRYRYGVEGTAWISHIELGPEPRSLAVVPLGQSVDPESPHAADQASLFAAGTLRAAWFLPDDVAAHARRTYRPDASAGVR